MTIWIDQPIWPRHGTVFAHLISDTSLDELHAFAHRVGLHPRSFEGDHYDVPQERYAPVLAAGRHLDDRRRRRPAAHRERAAAAQAARGPAGGPHTRHGLPRRHPRLRGPHRLGLAR